MFVDHGVFSIPSRLHHSVVVCLPLSRTSASVLAALITWRLAGLVQLFPTWGFKRIFLSHDHGFSGLSLLARRSLVAGTICTR